MQNISDKDMELLDRMNRNSLLKARMENLLSVVENAGDDIVKADDAERRVIEELRQMGNEALTGWAEKRIAISQESPASDGGQAFTRSGKKTPLAQYVRRNSCNRAVNIR